MRGTNQRDKIYVRGVCDICNDDSDVLLYDAGEQLVCAEHARRYARRNPRKQLCDKCGSDQGVVRDPSHRRNEYLCLDCHAENGLVIRDTVTRRAVEAVIQQSEH